MAEEIIKIETSEDGSYAVSGRELHMFLESKQNYTDWFKNMCEYGFSKELDFTEVWSNHKNMIVPFSGSARSMAAKGFSVDHLMSIDMAKEISMLQRNEKGKQARQYFIECEKKWKSGPMGMEVGSSLQSIALIGKAITEFAEKQMAQDARIKELEADISQQKKDNEELRKQQHKEIQELRDGMFEKPPENAMTLSQIADFYGLYCEGSGNPCAGIIGDICSFLGIRTTTRREHRDNRSATYWEVVNGARQLVSYVLYDGLKDIQHFYEHDFRGCIFSEQWKSCRNGHEKGQWKLDYVRIPGAKHKHVICGPDGSRAQFAAEWDAYDSCLPEMALE